MVRFMDTVFVKVKGKQRLSHELGKELFFFHLFLFQKMMQNNELLYEFLLA